MTEAEAPALYEAAVRGEPLQRAVFPELLNTGATFWTVGDWPIAIPPPAPHIIPRLQRVISQIRGQTGWSARRLAEVVGSSHTTILNAENGRPLVSGHSDELRQRLLDVYAVVERVYVLAGRDPRQTEAILSTAPPNRLSAADELATSGDAGRAYVAALDVLRPRRPHRGRSAAAG